MLPSIGAMPAIVIVALTFTVPTSVRRRSAPDRNSRYAVSFPDFSASPDVGSRSRKSVGVRLGRAANDSQLQSMIRQIRNPIEFDMKIRLASRAIRHRVTSEALLHGLAAT